MIVPAPTLFRFRDQLLIVLPAALSVVMFQIFNPHYLNGNLAFWLCIGAMPMCLQYKPAVSTRILPALFLIASAFTLWLPSTVGPYLVMLCVVLYSLATLSGGASLYVLFLGLIASPLFDYFTQLVSFSLRMNLSRISALMLDMLVGDVTSEGSIILVNGQEFNVDEACAGLFMLKYGLLFGTVLLSNYSGRNPWRTLFLGYSGLIFLILMGNAVRIIMLVLLNIAPDQFMHQWTGLLIFVLQILLPFFLMLRMTHKAGVRKNLAPARISAPLLILLPCGYLILLCLTDRSERLKSPQSPPHYTWSMEYARETLPGGIVKYFRDDAMVYVKPPVAPYRSDHNPAICWKGSGYTFSRIGEMEVQDHLIKWGTLKKEDALLYSAWWYQSTEWITSDNWEWRYRSVRNREQFYLINVTATSESLLRTQVREILVKSNRGYAVE